MIVEDAAGDVEQLANERVTQRVTDGQSFLLRRNDVLISKDRQLLRDDGLVEPQCLLQFLHGASTSHEDLQRSDSGGMRQRSEELGLERLELAGDYRCSALPSVFRPNH
jgi:hypothetical protein